SAAAKINVDFIGCIGASLGTGCQHITFSGLLGNVGRRDISRIHYDERGHDQINMNRRSFLHLNSGLIAAPFTCRIQKENCGLVTMYTDDRRLKSHAAVIVGRMLNGYQPNGVRQEPRTTIVSMYTDQVPPNDLSR